MSKLLAQQETFDTAKAFLILSLLDDSDEEDLNQAQREEREEQEDLAIISYALAAQNRYIDRPISNRKRDNYFFDKKWYYYNDREFLQQFRTTRNGFAVITGLIQGNPIFTNKSNLAQTHPAWQLAIALMRLGHNGSRASPQIIASDVGIGTGTIVEYTKRVVAALVSIAPDWVQWPDENERMVHGQEMRLEGFPGCIGFIDGTTLPLAFRPSMEGGCYFDRKKRYSVNAQVICDKHGTIIALDVGGPGAVADSTVFKSMRPYMDPSGHFSPGQFLLADAAYGVTVHCIPPYKVPMANLPDNTSFNYYLACSRVRNEHCIGVFKGRWQSLRELRHRIQKDDDMEQLCHWVLACAVLHNILTKNNDHWLEERIDDSENNIPVTMEGPSTVSGFTFRETLKKTTLETNRLRKRR